MIQKTLFRSFTGFIIAAALSQGVSASTGLSTEEANTLVKEDIAAAQVMREVCPGIVGTGTQLEANLDKLIKSYLNDYSDKSMTYEKLQSDAEYVSILKDAHKDAAQTSKDEQKSVCEDVVNYTE